MLKENESKVNYFLNNPKEVANLFIKKNVHEESSNIVVKYSDSESLSGSEKEEKTYRLDFATDYHAKKINIKIEKIEQLVNKEALEHKKIE